MMPNYFIAPSNHVFMLDDRLAEIRYKGIQTVGDKEEMFNLALLVILTWNLIVCYFGKISSSHFFLFL